MVSKLHKTLRLNRYHINHSCSSRNPAILSRIILLRLHYSKKSREAAIVGQVKCQVFGVLHRGVVKWTLQFQVSTGLECLQESTETAVNIDCQRMTASGCGTVGSFPPTIVQVIIASR